MEIQHVFIQGAGIMGNGIAQVSAQAGFQVTHMDMAEHLVQKGMTSNEKGLQRSVEKGKMAEADKSAVLSRIQITTDLERARGADLAIEAVFEDLKVK